jgi:hypothetical protein
MSLILTFLRGLDPRQLLRILLANEGRDPTESRKDRLRA